MAAVTDDELQKKRDRNERLREQIAAAEADAATRASEAANEITAKQLDAENARLEARLAQAKEAAKASSVKDGASSVLASVDDQLKAARAAASNPVGPVDTNAGRKSSTDNEE